ncbi:MAG: hypothetical protein ACRDUA_08520 [Micromonosporaceae bacterium]
MVRKDLAMKPRITDRPLDVPRQDPRIRFRLARRWIGLTAVLAMAATALVVGFAQPSGGEDGFEDPFGFLRADGVLDRDDLPAPFGLVADDSIDRDDFSVPMDLLADDALDRDDLAPL